uniref:Cytochrome P450 oxidase 79D2-like protein n=1 Tax=Platycodon grandiflorus TaxID=94286 RepID=A0A2I7M6E8_PLAGD|nr:cytochrome P450 oxidase 79D2-like protein [Platycodon grandiflorus]
MTDIFSPQFLSLGGFFLLIVALVSYHIAKRFHHEKRPIDRPPLPPGPKPWPLVGSLFTLLRNKPAFKWIHSLMHDMDIEIMCLRFWSVHVITVTSPKIAREFLKKQDEVFMSRPFCMSAFVTSGGYLTAALSPLGDQSKKMRRILASDILSPSRHRWLHAKRIEEADHLIRYVFSQCGWSGGVVNVRVAAQHFCGNVIRKMVFGKRFFGKGAEDGGPGPEEIEQVAALFTTLSTTHAFCISDYVPWLRNVSINVNKHFPLLVRIPFFGRIFDPDHHGKIIMTANAIIRKLQDPEVDERIHQWANGTRTQEEDLLDVLIGLKDEAGIPLLSSDEIKSQIMELMLATIDNPSNATEWAIAEMINQPQMLSRAWDELDRVVGRDRFVQEDDLPKLNYVKACAKEAFRLHPVAPFNVTRVSLKDTQVCGYFITKGSHLLVSRLGLGRNPEVWEDPLRFDPERHLVEGQDVFLTDHELRLLSFSTGRRGCPGVLLGSTLTTMLLARMLQAFTWEVPPTKECISLSESERDLLMAKPLLAAARPRLAEHLYYRLE